MLLAPESPWWLIRQNRIEDAKKALRRLTSGEYASDSHIDKTVALMVATTEHERRINSSTSYIACFKGTDFRRTMLVVFLFCMQIIGGTTLRAYATYFFEQAGLPTEQAFNMSIITYVLSFVGTVLSVRSFWSCLFSQASTLTTGSSEVVSNALHWAANALSLGPLREYCYLLRYWRAGCSQQQQ